MDLDKLYMEIEHVQDEMSKTAAGTEAYDKLTEELLNQYRVLCEAEKLNIEQKSKDLEAAFREKESLREELETKAKEEQAKQEAYIGLMKTLAGGSLMLTGILMTIYAEETKVITSKAWQIATHLIPKI